MGYSAFPIPKNRGSFVDVRPIIEEALAKYKEACLSGTYPPEDQSFHMQDGEFDKFKTMI